MRGLLTLGVVLACVLGGAAEALAQQHRLGGGAVNASNPKGQQNLPVTQTDAEGNQWTVQSGGWLQLRRNMPLYAQAGMLIINGNQPNVQNNMARWDEKTGELVLDDMNTNDGITVSRRIFFNKELGYVRMIDVLRNTQGQEVRAGVQVQSSLNFGGQNSQLISDPKKADVTLGWVAPGPMGRAAAEVFTGSGSKVVPQVTAPQGNNMVQAMYNLTLPAGKEVAIVHVHASAKSADAGKQFIATLKAAKLLAGVPSAMRKLILNFPGGSALLGDREVLRGELFDVVELRGGDTLNGTLLDKTFKLDTFFGTVELPAERVVGLLNVGEFRPRQLVITSDGEIFGGTLAKRTVDLQLGSGQTVQVPLAQLSRAGYRKRSGEPEEWPTDKPMLTFRTGERMVVAPPTGPIEFLTRYGLLKLQPASVAAIVFQSEDTGVHELRLTDGSRCAGLASAEQFNLTLAITGQPINVPTSSLGKLVLVPPVDPDESTAATMALTNDDVLVGTLAGQLKLDTVFDTITINAVEVRTLAHGKEAALADVQVTMWDGTQLSGQLQEPALKCDLGSGISVSVPVALVDVYNQPQPQPSVGMLDKIKAVVAELGAEDWKQRERAEQQLIAMGASVAPVLKQLRPTQAPEAQQRIDAVLKQVEGKSAGGE